MGYTYKKEKKYLYGTGYILRKLRHEKGASQKELCGALHWGTGSYNHMERGSRDITLNELAVLAEYYAMPVEALVKLIVETPGTKK